MYRLLMTYRNGRNMSHVLHDKVIVTLDGRILQVQQHNRMIFTKISHVECNEFLSELTVLFVLKCPLLQHTEDLDLFVALFPEK